jgi:hypothetical protein
MSPVSATVTVTLFNCSSRLAILIVPFCCPDRGWFVESRPRE